MAIKCLLGRKYCDDKEKYNGTDICLHEYPERCKHSESPESPPHPDQQSETIQDMPPEFVKAVDDNFDELLDIPPKQSESQLVGSIVLGGPTCKCCAERHKPDTKILGDVVAKALDQQKTELPKQSEGELLPCPLCGCEILEEFEKSNNQANAIYCAMCPYGVEDNEMTMEQLRQAHNTRANK